MQEAPGRLTFNGPEVADELDEVANPSRGSETVAHSMLREIGAMCILKAAQRWYCVKAKSNARGFAELETSARSAIIGEANEPTIEGRIPECREQ